MPAGIFNGVNSFGLVSVPIAVRSAAEDHSVHFRRIHTADGGRVRNRYWCEAEDREVTYGEVGRGYQLPDGRVIPVTEEELRSLPLTTARAIELVAFIPAAAVDPLHIGPGYYLQPQGTMAAKPYVLLLRALQRATRVAVAKFAWHGRERTGLLRVRGDVIALQALLWPDEIRDPAPAAPACLDDDEIDQAVALIEAMTRDGLTAPEFTDHYTAALREVIEAKQEGHRLPETPVPARPRRPGDLKAGLKESVDKARAACGEDEGDIHHAPDTAAKKATARTAPTARPTTPDRSG